MSATSIDSGSVCADPPEATSIAKGRSAEEWFRIAYSATDNGDLDRAADMYSLALEVDPTLWTARYNLALVAYQQDRRNDALSGFKDVLAQKPDHFRSLNMLGLLEFRSGNLTEAVQHLRDGIQVAEHYPQLWFNLALVLNDLNLPSAAANARRKYQAALDIRESVFAIADKIPGMRGNNENESSVCRYTKEPADSESTHIGWTSA